MEKPERNPDAFVINEPGNQKVVANTKSGAENAVEASLVSAGINQLLPMITAEIGNVKKGKLAQAGGTFKYRGIDDALNAISPILTRHGVSVSIRVDNHQTELFSTTKKNRDGETEVKIKFHATLTMEVEFFAPDGSSRINRAAGEGIDQMGGDKASNKAMSAAMKYAMFFGLLVPVHADDVEDPDADDGSEPEMMTAARKHIRMARDKSMVTRLKDRIEKSEAFDEEQRTILLFLVDDKAQQIAGE